MACHQNQQQFRPQQRLFYQQHVVGASVTWSRRRGAMRRRRLDLGDMVRVKYGVVTPRYGWGHVRPEHVGTIERILDKTCRVRFSSGLWKGSLHELELVTNPADSVASVVFGMTERLFMEKQFADMTFVLADGQEQAHKAVLAASSDAFAAMFSQPMQESASHKVELLDTKVATMRAFLRLLYTGRIDTADWLPRQDQDCSAASSGCDGHSKRSKPASGQEPDQIGAAISQAIHDGPGSSEVHPEDEADVADPDADDSEEEEEEDDDLSGDDSDARTGSSCNENTWVDLKEREVTEMPLHMLLDVADLAHRYMVTGILTLLIDALRMRLFRYFVELEVCPVSSEQLFWAGLQEIIVFAKRNDILVLRVGALHMARRSAVMRKAFRAGKLWAEVRQELSANWPLAPQLRCNAVDAHSPWLT